MAASSDVPKKLPNVSKKNKQKEMLEQQLKLLKNKQVRAVPGGYYTGLINDMHRDYANFQAKSTFLQMDQLSRLVQQTKRSTQTTDRFIEETRVEERKLEKLPVTATLLPSAVRCTLPADYHRLEGLSSLSFLTNFVRPSLNRKEVLSKLLRRAQRNSSIDIDDAKEIVLEYFHQTRTAGEIDELFHSLNIPSMNTLQSKEVLLLCCYAERYFLHRLAMGTNVPFERPLQEIIDFEFLKRKLDGIELTDDLRKLLLTLQAPDEQRAIDAETSDSVKRITHQSSLGYSR